MHNGETSASKAVANFNIAGFNVVPT